jgi:hypothetical protein
MMRGLAVLAGVALAIFAFRAGGPPAPDYAGPIAGWHEDYRHPMPDDPGPGRGRGGMRVASDVESLRRPSPIGDGIGGLPADPVGGGM